MLVQALGAVATGVQIDRGTGIGIGTGIVIAVDRAIRTNPKMRSRQVVVRTRAVSASGADREKEIDQGEEVTREDPRVAAVLVRGRVAAARVASDRKRAKRTTTCNLVMQGFVIGR